MPGYLEQLVEYDIWATARLLDVVEAQRRELLDATTPGVFGTVRETLHHMLQAERSYVARLMGEASPEPLEPLDLVGMRSVAGGLAAELRRLVSNLPEPGVEYQRRLGPVTAATVLTQLFWHGCEHRAQVSTILGANGISAPLDPWIHGRALAGLPPLE